MIAYSIRRSTPLDTTETQNVGWHPLRPSGAHYILAGRAYMQAKEVCFPSCKIALTTLFGGKVGPSVRTRLPGVRPSATEGIDISLP